MTVIDSGSLAQPWADVVLSGAATVHTFTVVHRAPAEHRDEVGAHRNDVDRFRLLGINERREQ